jgi:hypothetical protein
VRVVGVVAAVSASASRDASAVGIRPRPALLARAPSLVEGGLHSLEWLVLILAGTLMSVLLRKSSRGSPSAAAGSFGNERPRVSPDSESSVSRTILISAGSTCAALGGVTLVG